MFDRLFASFIASVLIASPCLGFEQGKDYTVIPERSKLPILSPHFAEVKTQKIKLDNGLEAYLISDPKADLNGAMLSVNVGSWEDPDEHPGLAHFLEHMLFLGTLKYPKESEYQKFIAEHGGQTNAFTSNNTTSYLFTVGKGAFPEALARFSSFFKEPLFNPSGVSREMHAIDQEYAKNLEQDDIRRIFVLKELADPKHPLTKFNMGNSASLENASRQALDQWFRERYSSNLMKLVVYSSVPLDKLRDLVIADFSGIPDNTREPLIVAYPAFPPEKSKDFIYIEPIQDIRTLTLVWELPSKFARMQATKPDEVISHVLGHEGEKSLLAQLKRENLADSLSSGGIKLGDDLEVLYVQIELTNEGLRDVDQVVARTFQAIKKLQDRGVPQYLFDEIKNMATIEYQYQSKQDEFRAMMKHAYQIQDEDMSTYPEYSSVIQQYDLQGIKEFLSYLTPQNAQYLIMAPSQLTGVKPNKKEKWMGVAYGRKPIGKELIDKWAHLSSHEMIDLPPPNPFIPDDLQLVNKNTVNSNRLVPKTVLIANDPKNKVYYAYDDKFGVPKVSWIFNILTPKITLEDPGSVVLGDLYVKSIKEALNKYSYPAKMAGLEFSIDRDDNGVTIKINGYSQNAGRLLDEILNTIAGYKPEDAAFKLYKEALLRKYQNFAMAQPIEQTLEQFKGLLYEEFVTEKDKANALRKVTFDQYKRYVSSLFDQTYLKAILYGNLTEEKAKTLVETLNETFYGNAYPESQHLKNGVIVLPQDKGPFYVEGITKARGNAAILAIENDNYSFKDRAAQQILMQAIEEPFFTALRTKQQTGYLVQSVSEEVERKLFNIFAVQSNTHDPRDLLSRFEQFIEGYLQEMGVTELNESQFENIRKSFVLKYQEPAKNTTQMGELLDTLAFDYDGDFSWIDQRLSAFKQLSYPEFLELSKEFLGRSNKRRLAILFKGSIPDGNDFTYTRARTWHQIRKMSEYETKEGGVSTERSPGPGRQTKANGWMGE